jgi:hypothetical protein
MVSIEMSQGIGKELVEKDGKASPWIWVLSGKSEYMSVLYLVYNTKDCDASDPRDRLFVLYGISAEAHKYHRPTSTGSAWPPQTFHEGFADLTKWIIKKTYSLDILVFSRLSSLVRGYKNSRLKIQLWIPNLASKFPIITLIGVYGIKAPGAYLADCTENLRSFFEGSELAQCTPSALRQQHHDRTVLVSSCSPTIGWPDHPKCLVLLLPFPRYATENRLTRNLYSNCLARGWSRYVLRTSLLRPLQESGVNRDKTWVDYSYTLLVRSQIFPHDEWWLYWSWPRSTEPGGIVVLLHGGKIPYILTEKDIESCGSMRRGFEFIGERFVHGTRNSKLF